MKKSMKMSIIVAVAIVTLVGVAYAVTHIGDYYRAYGFMADGTVDDDTSNTEMSQYRIHFTSGNDTIGMSTGDDEIQMAGGNDIMGLGPGSDKILFHGGYNGETGTSETIGFNYAETTYIKYTLYNDTIEIKSNSGDVIITLGQ